MYSVAPRGILASLFALALGLAGVAVAEMEPHSVAHADRAGQELRVLEPGQRPDDQRKSHARMIISGHPFSPPASREAWDERRQAIRTRVLVASGLFPMPPRPRIEATIHGKIDKEGYTIEKVYFESLPGHFVCGNLYRPQGRTGRLPAVLFPHGHFGDGRLYQAKPEEVAEQMRGGGEHFAANAQYPAQAPLVTLARLGCVVFQYDMVGRGDSRSISHRRGYDDAEAVLRLQSFLSLQTWNSLRALDFLCSQPDVEPARIGVAGASGGATQTILLCAIDDRVACEFPAVMVSTTSQGGCTCENAPLLRIGGGNVEIAAVFAPKPLGMTNANDWTSQFEKKGLPELRALYDLLGSPENVMARRFPQYRHNFNQVSREVMYQWLNEHLQLGAASVEENEISPVTPTELSVFDENHRVDWSDVERLRKEQTRLADQQWAEMTPQSLEAVAPFQKQLCEALQVMVASRLPRDGEVSVQDLGSIARDDFRFDRLVISRVADPSLFVREAVPTAVFVPKNWDGRRMVVWAHAQGHAGLLDETRTRPGTELASILKQGFAVLSPDGFLTGEHLLPDEKPVYPHVSMESPRFTLTYNRTILAQRVHDVLTAVGAAKSHYRAESVDLLGLDEAGPWVILARSLCGSQVRRTAADCSDFRFANVHDISDPKLLPGGLKYGDLLGLARLIAPNELFLEGAQTSPQSQIDSLRTLYSMMNHKDSLTISPGNSSAQALNWITAP